MIAMQSGDGGNTAPVAGPVAESGFIPNGQLSPLHTPTEGHLNMESTALPAESGMTWSVRQSFLAYIAASGGSTSAGDGATVDGAGTASWPLADSANFRPADMEGRLRFAGRVRYTAHMGLLEVDIVRPELDLAGGMAILSSQGQRLATFQVHPVDGPGGYVLLVGQRGRLDASALGVFGNAYTVETELDPLVVALAPHL